MSQNIFSTIDPAESGTDLATALNAFKDAIVSGMSGATRPTELQAGGYWVDTSNDPTSWAFRLWTGVSDVLVFTIDLATGAASMSTAVDSFQVKRVSADTVGAVMELVKRRIATSGQVLSGDTVAEIRCVGRDNAGGNPVVAKIIYVAADNETSSAFGGTLSFYSTPAGSAVLTEHMRFVGGMVETIVPHKINAQVLAGQNVATAATIAQLNADKILVEMTGATGTNIQGINSGNASKVVSIHNRSSASVVLKHQDAGAAAADRIQLPEGRDITLLPQDTATLYYCTTDTRWKLQHASARFAGFTTDSFVSSVGSWVAPSTASKVRVVAHSKKNIFSQQPDRPSQMRVMDVGKNLWSWGQNTNGSLGDGTTVSKSSPVQVTGGLKFVSCGGHLAPANATASFGLTEAGVAYMWGLNANGQLGVGDVLTKSSPTAVTGGYTFRLLVAGFQHTLGLSPNGIAYAWGQNANGELGDGTVTPKSSPVAVAGPVVFRELVAPGGFSGSARSFGLDLSGNAYAWGLNTNGQLGLGDVLPRSSPVAVLGGLTFRVLNGSADSIYGLTAAGALYAWGRNQYGQLGHGDVIPKSSPVAVVGGLVIDSFHTDPDNVNTGHIIALDSTGSAWAWGLNDKGQLGDGTFTTKSSPVAVVGGLTFKKVLASQNSSYGLTKDGLLYAWGFNDGGQLGDNTFIAKSSPVAVVGGLSFQDVTAVRTALGPAIIALTWDGKLYAWGWNATGELGDGSTTPKSSPVAVLGGLSLRTQDDSSSVLDITVTPSNTYGLKLGAGPCFFGNNPIGNDIDKVDVVYVP